MHLPERSWQRDAFIGSAGRLCKPEARINVKRFTRERKKKRNITLIGGSECFITSLARNNAAVIFGALFEIERFVVCRVFDK